MGYQFQWNVIWQNWQLLVREYSHDPNHCSCDCVWTDHWYDNVRVTADEEPGYQQYHPDVY